MPKMGLQVSVVGSKCCPVHISHDLLRRLKEDNEVEPDYERFLLNHYVWEDERVESNKKLIEKDEEDGDRYDEGENDPRYELFLQNLKVHEKSYILECEESGSPCVIKYEEDSNSDKECDVEPRRKLRSATNRRNGTSNQALCSQSIPSKAAEKLIGRKLRNASECGKGKNVKVSTPEPMWEIDYCDWSQNLIVGDYLVLKYGSSTVVYEENGQYSLVKHEYNDESSSDVEFLESTFHKEGNPNPLMIEFKDEEKNSEIADNSGCSSDVEILECTFNKEENLNFSMKNEGSTSEMNDIARFKEKVIAALRKPYNQQEYDRLLQDAEFCRPEERHLDLRYGRERSYSVKKDGKSYLDYYPALRRKLVQVLNDKPRRLNLLRGLFIWLKRPGPLCPWEDPDCLAIKPGSSPGLLCPWEDPDCLAIKPGSSAKASSSCHGLHCYEK